MKKKLLWFTSVAMAIVLTACAGGNGENAVESEEDASNVSKDITAESTAESDTKSTTEITANDVGQVEDTATKSSASEEATTGKEPSIEVYHNPDMEVKYSDDKVTLCYQDQEIDISHNFGKVDLNDEIGGYDSRVYLLDRDGKGVYVTVKYKYGCAALDDFLIADWTEEYHNYLDEDISAIYDFRISEDTDMVNICSSQDNWDSGTFYSNENGQMMIVPAIVGANEMGTNSVMVYTEGAEELSYELADDVDIWLYEPVQGAYGAMVTRDAFLSLLKQYRIDCGYHLNEAGKIDYIRGVYYA